MAAIVTSEDFTGRINIDTHSIAISEQLDLYAIDAQERIFTELFVNKDFDATSLMSTFAIKKMIACLAYCTFITEYKVQATVSGEKSRQTTGTTSMFNISKYVTAFNDYVEIYNKIIDEYLPTTDLVAPCKLNYVNRFGL